MNLKNKIFLILLFSLNIECTSEKFVIGCHWGAGFFSCFLGVLNRIIWAEKNGKIPVIYWDEYSSYFDQKGYNDSFNVWQYYFEPISNLDYEKGDFIDHNYIAADGSDVCRGPNLYLNPDLRNQGHQIIQKYIKIKQKIKNKIDQFYEKNMILKKNIGIHLRGTDKITEVNFVDVNLIFNKANEIADTIENCQFFIATDEERLLNLAKTNLKRPVIYYNSHRSISEIPLHLSNLYRPILGEEILIEAQLLSKCDVFIHTYTNIADGVLYFNPSIKNIYIKAE